MGQRLDLASRLEALASAAPTLAEAQALQARAAHLRRRSGAGYSWALQPIFRN